MGFISVKKLFKPVQQWGNFTLPPMHGVDVAVVAYPACAPAGLAVVKELHPKLVALARGQPRVVYLRKPSAYVVPIIYFLHKRLQVLRVQVLGFEKACLGVHVGRNNGTWNGCRRVVYAHWRGQIGLQQN